MSDQMHTPEPWVTHYSDCASAALIIAGSIDCEVAQAFAGENYDFDTPGYREQCMGNAHRIVACVNALEGIADPSAVRELVEAAAAYVAADKEAGYENRPMARPSDADKVRSAKEGLRTALAKLEGGA